MKDIDNYIQEKLRINKDTKVLGNYTDHSKKWENIDKWTKYEYDSIYYFLELIKDKIDWKSEINSLYKISFNTNLTKEDLDELNKQLGKDNVLASHEWIYDSYNTKYPSFRIYMHKQPLIKIECPLMHPNKYSITLDNSAETFYKKYYKNIVK